MNRPALAFAAVVVTAGPWLARAQPAGRCPLGRPVSDKSGNLGVVVAADGALCLLRYRGGEMQGWVPRQELRPAARHAQGGVAVLRPGNRDRLVFPVDALGHVMLTATVNGAPVRFLVDTGASLVTLTPGDASAAGLAPDALVFNRTMETGNGPVRAAVTVLREVRIGPLAIDNVPAAVIDSLRQSVLGMSFLRRLKGFAVQGGALTIRW